MFADDGDGDAEYYGIGSDESWSPQQWHDAYWIDAEDDDWWYDYWNQYDDEWLDDWTTYIGNRQRYVENLRVDDEARFLETTKGSDTKGITRAINSFAQVNRMDSCETPADLS